MNHKMKTVHPGAILREDVLKEMEVTVAEAAKGLQISEQQNADFWLDLQKKYDLWMVQESGQVKNIQRFGQAVA